MPLSNVALVIMPLLVSGFLFTLIFYPTRFISAKFDGQRLFFFAATVGIFFGVITALIYPTADRFVTQYWPSTFTAPGVLLQRIFPVESPGALFLCVFLAFTSALLFNAIFSVKIGTNKPYLVCRNGWQWTIDKLIRRVGDPLQQLLIRAVTAQKKVIVNLKSGRAYIGWVYRVPPRPHVETSYIEILTEYSLFRTERGKFPERKDWSVYPGAKITELRGYVGTLIDSVRNVHQLPHVPDTTKKKLADLLEKKLDEARAALAKLEDVGSLTREDWIRVIPTDEIESLSYFDEGIFQWFKSGEGVADLKSAENFATAAD